MDFPDPAIEFNFNSITFVFFMFLGMVIGLFLFAMLTMAVSRDYHYDCDAGIVNIHYTYPLGVQAERWEQESISRGTCLEVKGEK